MRKPILVAVTAVLGLGVTVACSTDDTGSGSSDTGSDGAGPDVGDDAVVQDVPEQPCRGPECCYTDGWCTATFDGSALWVDIWASGPDDIWVLGQDARLRRFDGDEWIDEQVPANDLLGNIWGRTPDEVWVSGYQGEVLMWNGARWVHDDLPTAEDRIESFGATGPAAPVHGLGASGTIYRRSDSAGWEAVASIGDGDLGQLWACDGQLYAAVSGDVFGDEGDDRWVRYGVGFDQDQVESAVALPDGETWVAAGGLMRHNGERWRYIFDDGLDDGLEEGIFLLAGTSATDVWAAYRTDSSSRDGLLYYDGETWTTYEQNSGDLVALWSDQPGEVLMADSRGDVSLWDGELETALLDGPLRGTDEAASVHFNSRTEVYAVIDEEVFRWNEISAGWDVLGRIDEYVISDVWASGPDDVWVVVGTDRIYHYDGVELARVGTLLPIPGPEAPRFSAVWGSGPDDVWISSLIQMVHYTGSGYEDVPEAALYGSENGRRVELVGRGADDIWAIQSFNLYAHFDGDDWLLEPFDNHERHLGCADVPGEIVAVTTEPLEVVQGPAGATRPLSDEIQAYGVSDAWLGGPDNVWVVGNNPTTGAQIMRFDGEWHESLAASGSGLLRIWGFDDGSAVAAGYDAILMRTP